MGKVLLQARMLMAALYFMVQYPNYLVYFSESLLFSLIWCCKCLVVEECTSMSYDWLTDLLKKVVTMHNEAKLATAGAEPS